MKEIIDHADDISRGFVLLDGNRHNEATIIYVADERDEAYRTKARNFVRIFPHCGGGPAKIGLTVFEIAIVFINSRGNFLSPHKTPRHLAVVTNGMTGETFLLMRKHVPVEKLLQAMANLKRPSRQVASLNFQTFFSDIVIGKIEH